MIVSSKIVKPQNVRKCAVPGTVHFSSLRCPRTSVVSDPDVAARMLADGRDPVRRRLPAEGQPLEPPHPAPGDREREPRSAPVRRSSAKPREPPQYPELKRSLAGGRGMIARPETPRPGAGLESRSAGPA